MLPLSSRPNRVAEARRNLGMTQAQLCDRTGLTPANLCRIENGRCYIGSGTRARVAKALDTSEDELFPIEHTPALCSVCRERRAS